MSSVQVLQMSSVQVLQMSSVHVLQMSPVQVLQVQSSAGFTTCLVCAVRTVGTVELRRETHFDSEQNTKRWC